MQEPEVAPEPEVIDATDISPELEWCAAPLCVLWAFDSENPQLRIARPQPDDMFACGEGSQERQEREAYRHLHPHLDFGPGDDPLTNLQGSALDCPTRLTSLLYSCAAPMASPMLRCLSASRWKNKVTAGV